MVEFLSKVTGIDGKDLKPDLKSANGINPRQNTKSVKFEHKKQEAKTQLSKKKGEEKAQDHDDDFQNSEEYDASFLSPPHL